MQLEYVKRSEGFTLVEVMIVVAIMGILAAIAIPQYQQYVIRGNRAAAQSFMMEIASRQKQYLLDARAYAPDLNTLVMVTPNNVSNNYTIIMSVPGGIPPTFTVTATPIPGKPQAADGVLTLDDAGNKDPVSKW
jgi:type IV pilus assembly protein PilE